MEKTEENVKVVIVYKTYSPAHNKAQQKYYNANKQKIIERNVNYYRTKKDTDEYKQQKAVYNRAYRERKKLAQQQQQAVDEQ